MSMLAGPRRKQKWTLNPRGKQWSEDSSKFGQKMLEKMGWSHGKGLGAKEQGMVEHIRVKVKNDQVGFGFDKNKDDQWTEHQDVFNNLLQNLQKEQNAEVTEETDKVLSGKSLEEKSKQSQKRVHYKKFTRGKDVNKYSTKDLANIFGKKDLNEKSVKEEKVDDEAIFYDPVGTKDMTAGILTIKGGNISDYFQKKLYTDDQNQTSQDNNNVESESEQRPGFGFSVKSKSKFYVNNHADHGDDDTNSETEKYTGFGFTKNNDVKPKLKNINSLNYVFDNPCLDLNILDNSPVKKIKTEILDQEYVEEVTPNKWKSEFIYDNGGLDLKCPDIPTPKKRKYEAICEEGDTLEKSTPKKSKKHKNKRSSNVCENSTLDLEYPDKPKMLNVAEKNSLSNGIENPGLDLDFSDRQTPKKVKNIKNESLANGIENPALDLDFPDTPTPKKVKKIKNDPLSNGIENPVLDLDFLDKPTPKKIKTIKNEPSSDSYENAALDLEYSNRSENRKTKNKKLNSESFSNGYENPAMELEEITPKKIKKEIESTSNGIENYALDLGFPDRSTPKKKSKVKPIDHLSLNSVLDLNNQEDEVQSTTDFEVLRPPSGLQNNAFDDFDEAINKKRVTFNEYVEYNTDITKKKKKKKKLDKYEVVNEKTKKKRKSIEPSIFINEALDEDVKCAEEFDNEINEKRTKKGKRRKERRISLLETIEEAPEDENTNETVADQAKKASKITCDVEVIGQFPCEDVEIISSKNSFKKNHKIKNIPSSTEVASQNCNLAENNELCEDTNIKPTEVSKKKKKKKGNKKGTLEEGELNNQTGDYEKENIRDDQDTKNVTSILKEKKKKKSDNDVISLEEFLSEDNSVQTNSKLRKQIIETAKKESNNIEISEENVLQWNNPSFSKFKTTKQIMKSLFLKNPTLMFNGSNINDIKGYGVETCEQ